MNTNTHRYQAWMSITLLVFACGAPPAFTADAAPGPAALEQAFTRLQTFDWGQNLDTLSAIEDAVLATRTNPVPRRELEQRLAACLARSAPVAARQYVCRKLSLIGTEASVPVLAAQLGSAELSHMARLALERIPGAAASEALRDALPRVADPLKIGIIQSLGARSDAQAVGVLTDLLRHGNNAVAGASATALGHIGTPEAARALAAFLRTAPPPLRPTVTDAWLLAAERLLRRGQRSESLTIYQHLFANAGDDRIRIAAFHGLVNAEPDQSFARLSGALAGNDDAIRTLAAGLVVDWPNAAEVRRLADTLGNYPPSAQVALLGAFRLRREASARPAALEMTQAASPPVRVAALRTLTVIGIAADVPLLARTAAEGKAEEREVARPALAQLPDTGVNRALITALAPATPAIQVELLRALAARGTSEATTDVAACLNHPNVEVRRAAVDALAELGTEAQVSLLAQGLRTADPPTHNRIERALKAIVARTGPKSLDALLKELQESPPEGRAALLRVVSAVPETRSLTAVRAALQDRKATVREAAMRVLAEWPKPDAAPDLLRLARTADNLTWRTLALRGYVRLSRQAAVPAAEKVQRLAEAMALAGNADAKRLVISGLAEANDPAVLKLIEPCLTDKNLVEEASLAVVQVAARLNAQSKDDQTRALRQVLKQSANRDIQTQARKLLERLGVKPD